MRASRPITIFFMPLCPTAHAPNAEVNFTISSGVKPSPAAPPIVPLIPEIDFMSVKSLQIFEPQK
jgi:hypothetical protein